MTHFDTGMLLFIGFLFGCAVAFGGFMAYTHEWNEECVFATNSAYWQGFDDGWSECGCGQGDGGGEAYTNLGNITAPTNR